MGWAVWGRVLSDSQGTKSLQTGRASWEIFALIHQKISAAVVRRIDYQRKSRIWNASFTWLSVKERERETPLELVNKLMSFPTSSQGYTLEL